MDLLCPCLQLLTTYYGNGQIRALFCLASHLSCKSGRSVMALPRLMAAYFEQPSVSKTYPDQDYRI
jgi:hypothetical protein